MKKLMFIVAALCGIVLCSSKCSEEPATIENVVVEETVIENVEWMKANFEEEFVRFETYVTYVNYLDEENEGAYDTITSVFEVIKEDEASADTKVVMFVTDKNVLQRPQIYDGFWVGDCVLKDEEIVYDFISAFNILMDCKYPKPHSKNCVLRKELGPVNCNPQYIFGNTQAQLYVDAVTGEVTDENPAYKGFGFKMPLGEWP